MLITYQRGGAGAAETHMQLAATLCALADDEANLNLVCPAPPCTPFQRLLFPRSTTSRSPARQKVGLRIRASPQAFS